MSKIETYKLNITQLDRPRTIRVYLPSDYEENDKKFDVLYMHDGHNLFSKQASGFGEIWDAHLALDDFFQKHRFGIILVGIDCDHIHRFDEYSPWESNEVNKVIPYLPLRSYGGEGDLYISWIVNELIPEINQKFKTTGTNYMAGSSMGGFVSLYAGFKYPNVFKKIGAMSCAFWFKKAEMIKLIKENYNSDLEIYLDVGTKEGLNNDEISKLYLNDTVEVANMLKALGSKNLMLKIAEGEIHSEQAWKRRFPGFLEWLLIR